VTVYVPPLNANLLSKLFDCQPAFDAQSAYLLIKGHRGGTKFGGLFKLFEMLLMVGLLNGIGAPSIAASNIRATGLRCACCDRVF
jgi:hypothetical protein